MMILLVGTAASMAEVVEECVQYAGTQFRVVKLDPAQVELAWKGPDGKPYATFARVQKAYAKNGKSLKFMMNAGIFEPGLVPSGLHVESGIEVRPVNLKEGEGNFFLKPNGVFLIAKDGKAKVFDANLYRAVEKPQLAIQSGPLLLKRGARHDAFRDGSTSIKHRNGAGVDEKGRVVFAMTDKGQDVNFWDFAGLFLELGCRDALFLDGDISQMAVNPGGEVSSNRFAAMFVVAE